MVTSSFGGLEERDALTKSRENEVDACFHAKWLFMSADWQRLLSCRAWAALQVKERAEKARPVVKQVKVLRDADKVNAAGKQASKGLAFVEFSEHEHALCALRQLNNNPAPFGALLSTPVTCCAPCVV